MNYLGSLVAGSVISQIMARKRVASLLVVAALAFGVGAFGTLFGLQSLIASATINRKAALLGGALLQGGTYIAVTLSRRGDD